MRTSLILILVLLPVAIQIPAGAEEVSWGGSLEMEIGARLKEVTPSDAEPRFEAEKLILEGFSDILLSENLRLYLEIRLGFQHEFFSTSVPLEGLTSPVDLTIEIREAFADLYNFPFAGLDLRAGRQRIAWGPANTVGVVDNLDPFDLRDYWRFGEHLSSDALRLRYFSDFFTLEGVFIPTFQPALLPDDLEMIMPPMVVSLPENVRLVQIPTASAVLPADSVADGATLAARVSGWLMGWDLAASYVYGRNFFPLLSDVAVTVDFFTMSGVVLDSIEAVMVYPRRHIFSLEAGGELFGLGLWGEASLFYPEDDVGIIDYEDIDMETPDVFTDLMDGKLSEPYEPYLKAVMGMDYTFPGGIYMNLQYVHGLAFENMRDTVQDYFFLGLEWKIWDDRLKIGPVAVALEIDDWRDLGTTWALLLNPELSFFPYDNTELTVGYRFIAGEEGTTFGRENGRNDLYLRGKFSF